jgi:hypothetical protein
MRMLQLMIVEGYKNKIIKKSICSLATEQIGIEIQQQQITITMVFLLRVKLE